MNKLSTEDSHIKKFTKKIVRSITFPLISIIRKFLNPLMAKVDHLESLVIINHNRISELLDKVNENRSELKNSEIRQRDLASALKLSLDHDYYSSFNLASIRSSQKYLNAYTIKDNPIISVIITTHTAPDVLFEKTIPSILTQSWRHIELLLIIDSLDPTIVERVEFMINKFDDNRIKVFASGLKLEIVSDSKTNWRNSGTFGTNYALTQVTGQWIAMFTHDDELIEGSFESLIKYSIESKLDFCYSKFNMIVRDLTFNYGSYPPVLGQFNLQGSIINAAFKDVIHHQYDSLCDIPNDWGYLLRIYNLGLKIGFLNKTTVNFYPSTANEIYETYKANN
jgi:hypothetical protein